MVLYNFDLMPYGSMINLAYCPMEYTIGLKPFLGFYNKMA